MTDTLKTSAIITVLFTGLMTIVFLAAPSYADPIDGAQSSGEVRATSTFVR